MIGEFIMLELKANNPYMVTFSLTQQIHVFAVMPCGNDFGIAISVDSYFICAN